MMALSRLVKQLHKAVQFNLYVFMNMQMKMSFFNYLDMFLKHPKVKDLCILRIYSKSIETKYYYGPHSNKVA